MAKRHIYRVGDKVRIVEPRFIERVGYPQTAGHLFKQFKDHPLLGEAAALLGIVAQPSALKGRIANDFAEGAARAANRAQGFGGTERAIHYCAATWEEMYRGALVEIYRKRTARTGLYYPPCGGMVHTDYGDEYDYQTGGLENAKTHVILSTDAGDIEAIHIQPADAPYEPFSAPTA